MRGLPANAIGRQDTLAPAIKSVYLRDTTLALFLLTLGACLPAGTGSSGIRDRDLITRAEIERSNAGSAYELVQTLRPEWLRPRGVATLQFQSQKNEILVVYLNRIRLGALETMYEVALGQVWYLRYFSAAEATYRWGVGHLQGAILISTEFP